MPSESEEERRRRKERERREKDQRRTERESSRMSPRYEGTNGEYNKARSKTHGVDKKANFVNAAAESSTRQYQTENREAERLDVLRERRHQEEQNRIAYRSPYRSERKGGLDSQGHGAVEDLTGRIANLDVSTARARRTSLYDRNDPRHESYQLPDMNSRNLHDRHARTAEEEARRSMRKADEHAHYARETSTPSSRERYPRIAEGDGRTRVALPPSGYYESRSESRPTYSSPLPVEPRDRSSLSNSSYGDPRVNLAPPPRANYAPYIRPEDRPPISQSVSMKGGSGSRHQKNPISWQPTRDDDISGLAYSVASRDSDSDDDYGTRLRKAKDGKKKRRG